MSAFDPKVVNEASASARWSALIRTGLELDEVAGWDTSLSRETRVLVPIDVQALVVPPRSTEPMARIPLTLTAPEGSPPASATGILEEGPPRPAGIHLHWAPPDALLRGSLGDHGGTNRLRLPPLPDRWVVIRIVAPKKKDALHLRAWVLEADTARAVPLENWPRGASAFPQSGRTVAADELTGVAGGSTNWIGVYDAVLNRYAFFDPLDDLATIAPKGVEGNQAAYVVAGWWSSPKRDPLDGVQTSTSLQTRLRQLRWRLQSDLEGGDQLHVERTAMRQKQAKLGLQSATRYQSAPPPTPPSPAETLAGISATMFSPASSFFADDLAAVVQRPPEWPRSTLLHGTIFGVPTDGRVLRDNRPAATDLGVVFGQTGDDLIAALASAALATEDVADRRANERILAAFSGHVLDRIGTADGVVDIEEFEHDSGFVSRPGGTRGIDHLLASHGGALAAGRKARATHGRKQKEPVKHGGISFAKTRVDLTNKTLDQHRETTTSWGNAAPDPAEEAEARHVPRPGPRLYLPNEPMIALRGAGRSLRHGGDGRFSPDGMLYCRWPSQVVRGMKEVVEARDLVPSLGSGAIPEEVTLLAREAALLNPYLAGWLADVIAAKRNLDANATRRRMVAEAALRFGTDAVFDGETPAFQPKSNARNRSKTAIASSVVKDELYRFSLVEGSDADPVGVTAWSQPWIPLWLDWEVKLTSSDRLEGWRLGAVDYELSDEPGASSSVLILQGRSVLTTGSAATLGSAVRDWLVAEDQRDRNDTGEADEATEAALSRIVDGIENVDMIGATLDGIREQLLGLVYDTGLVRPKQSDGTLARAANSGAAPVFLRGGQIVLQRARIIDAFGRTLGVPVAATRVPVRSEIAGAPATLQLPPRLTMPARLLFRLIDPGARPDVAAEATIDQITPAAMINPVAGFLLPDHIDEALELFDVDGTPLGQLMHEPISGGVVWEIAPGREGPADAGPLHGLNGGARLGGLFAAGMVTADARAREGSVADPARDSALSALLRVIDTTLWTVDAFRSLGSEHIAGLVGRPIAVVRARLTLEIQSDLGIDGAKATNALLDRAFTVRLGELTRGDDGLLAYFVDDDYEHVRIVGKLIAELAFESRRRQGQFGQYGTAPTVPPSRPIDHPYVIADDEIVIRPNQSITLTLLMHPGTKVHLTSGIVPRKELQLARDWVAPGLSVMAPSARIGPVLVDPTNVRLPKVSAFPKDQIFTRRDTPSTWKDDPILAATQAALLPELPHEVQEGYIRIAPNAEPEG